MPDLKILEAFRVACEEEKSSKEKSRCQSSYQDWHLASNAEKLASMCTTILKVAGRVSQCKRVSNVELH